MIEQQPSESVDEQVAADPPIPLDKAVGLYNKLTGQNVDVSTLSRLCRSTTNGVSLKWQVRDRVMCTTESAVRRFVQRSGSPERKAALSAH